jgi:hypothetical protein
MTSKNHSPKNMPAEAVPKHVASEDAIANIDTPEDSFALPDIALGAEIDSRLLTPKTLLQLQRLIGNRATAKAIQRGPAEEIRDKANIGIELEFRNIRVTHRERDWDKVSEVEKLTTGGVDGELVTDQQQGKSAIIEWSSNHPATSTTENAKKFQAKIVKLQEKLGSKSSGSLEEMINLIKPFFKVGDVQAGLVGKVTYSYNANAKTQTQVNLEVPFENIGLDLTGGPNAASDASKLFSGNSSDSKNAAAVFVKSREVANTFAQAMIENYNLTHAPAIPAAAKKGLASLLTIFFHTEILHATGGGKDAQGVLFKTGAGDLVRQALDANGKLVLWDYAHTKNLGQELAAKAWPVYNDVFKGRGGPEREGVLKAQVEKQANLAFKHDPTEVGTPKEQKDQRYGAEAGGYGATVDDDWYVQNDSITGLPTFVHWAAVDTTRPYQFFWTRTLSGVKTGKQFDVATHSNNANTQSSKYLIAEIRKLDNEINALAGKPISDIDRTRIGNKVKALQKPIL